MKIAKRILSIMLVLVTLISIVSISAEALSIVVKEDINYGYMVPVNYNGTEVLSTVKVYGSYDYINFYLYAKKYFTTYFFYEIYSDKKLTKCVQSGYFETEEVGSYSQAVKLKLKGKYKTKTYYVVTYVARYDEDADRMTVDADSMCQFKLAVDRTTAFSKQKVMLTKTKNTTKGAYIKWSALSGASKYYVYRRSITGTKWKKIGTTKRTSFTDTSVKNKNVNYIYTVKAVNKKGTVSRYHYAGLICLFAKTPVLSSVKVRYDNVVEVKWQKTSSAADYHVYRKTEGGSWKKIANCGNGTWFKDTTAKNGVKYTYSVKAVIETKYGKAVSSYYANDDKAVTYLEAPYVEEVSAAENGVSIKWLPVEGSTYYTILRKPYSGSKGWEKVGEAASDVTSFVDTTASVTDGAYLYAVRSNSATNNGSYEYRGRAYVILENPEFEIRESNGEYYLWCEEVPHANTYTIFSRESGGEWKRDGDVWAGNDTRKLNFPVPGEREFAVAAVSERYSVIFKEHHYIYSDYENNTFTLTDYPDINITASLFSDKIILSWKNTNAQSYNVYKKETLDDSAELQLVASVGESVTEYTDTDVQTNLQYTYVVKGVFDGVEQTEGANPCTISIYPKESITENVNAYFVENSSSGYNGIKVSGDIENAILYKYNESKDAWEQFFVHEIYDSFVGMEYHHFAMFGSSNKIKVGVSFLRENGRTAIDDYVIEIDRYQPQTTITQACTKTGVKITLTPDAQADFYWLRTTYDLLDDDIKLDVSDGKAVTHTFKATEMFDEGTGIKYGFIGTHAQRGDGSRTGESFELRFVAPPTLVDAKRNSSGYPVVKWSKSNINSDSTMHIYRKAPDGDWECIKSVKTSSLKTKKFSGYKSYNYYFVDKTAKSGVAYTYTVQQEMNVRGVNTNSYLNKTGVKTS